MPMYNVTPAVGAAWEAMLGAVIQGLRQRGWTDPMRVVPATGELTALWRAPDLLLSQTCGYPLVTELEHDVQVLAAPAFDLPGCAGVDYRSMILVPQAGGADSLEQLRGAVAVINQWHSHSGMNALRHTIAPLAREGRFFSRIEVSGSHMASIVAVQQGRADVAAVDCATYGLAMRAAPERLSGVRVLQATAAAPGLPLITSRALGHAQVQDLRAVLLHLHEDVPSVLERLCVSRLHAMDLAAYEAIRQQVREAAQHGYPTLA
ncbi:MAG: PhnD/SsuA/transferrin family substrate-binding protein [Rhodoferax sp.]|nr:PhnD/SsuA/transferrin family substrate-binding protein [Rhodoferax sp.]